jgi:retinol dehydrogenase-12
METFIKQNRNYIAVGFAAISLYFLRKFFNGPKSKYYRNLKSKVVIVTGSSEGIGKETALQLLKDEATVIFACRDEKKTLAIISKIENQDQKSRAIFMKLDLSDFDSVKKFIEQFRSKFDQLDILINNAGALFKKFERTINGIESTMQVNTFGPMLLTQGLIDLVHKSNGRVINVSSKIYERMDNNALYSAVDPEKYDFNEKTYSAFTQYGLSKIGNVFFTQFLHNYVTENKLNIKSAALHPGVIMTELSREYSGIIWGTIKLAIYPFLWLLSKNVRMGAETTLHLCYTPDESFQSGLYYSDSNVKPYLRHAADNNNAVAFMAYSRILINYYGQRFDVHMKI